MNPGNPFVTVSTVSIPFVAGVFGSPSVQFDVSKLSNVWRMPIELREIRFLLETRSVVSIAASPVVHVEMKFGKSYMTDGPVPISILAQHAVLDDSLSGIQIDATPTLDSISRRRIVLPKPMIMLPGKSVLATASIPPNPFMTAARFNTAFVARLHIALVGRFLPDGSRLPEVNHVPIISHVELTQERRISLEDDFRNPLATPIQIHRVIGERVRSSPTILRPVYAIAAVPQSSISFRFPNAETASELPAGFENVFSQNRVWPAKFDLGPSDRVRVQIEANSAETPPADGTFFGYQVAMIGTRVEAIS